MSSRSYLRRYANPAAAWLLSSSLGLGLALQLLSPEQGARALLLWEVGLVAAGTYLLTGALERYAPSRPPPREPVPRHGRLAEELADRLGPQAGAAAQPWREEASRLRSQARAARRALRGLAPEGPGARALAEAAQQAEARAARLEDQLAALYAQELSGADTASEAFEQPKALVEVESSTPERLARARTAARVREGG